MDKEDLFDLSAGSLEDVDGTVPALEIAKIGLFTGQNGTINSKAAPR